MSQLYRIYKSIAESIASTVSASYSSACITAVLIFSIYMGIQLVRCRYRNRSLQTFNMTHIFRQGIWLALFASYTYMVLFRTWIDRPQWEKPLEKIFGSWGLYTDKGEFTTEAIENGMLLLPFAWLLGMVMREKWKECPALSVLYRLTLGGFFMSLFIETVQVLWKRGTFQFSDLFYNTVGGMLGGVFFLVFRQLQKR